MIPDLPKGITKKDALDFYSKIAGNLSDQSTHHINWHTHRKGPTICWICDTNILVSRLLALQGFNTKSTVDSKIRLNQENESEPESEIGFMNYDEEAVEDPNGVPEYETI